MAGGRGGRGGGPADGVVGEIPLIQGVSHWPGAFQDAVGGHYCLCHRFSGSAVGVAERGGDLCGGGVADEFVATAQALTAFVADKRRPQGAFLVWE